MIWKSSEILRGEVIEDFEDDEQDLVRNAIFIGDPLKILQDRGYMMGGRSSGDHGSGRVWGQLEFKDGIVGDQMLRVAVI